MWDSWWKSGIDTGASARILVSPVSIISPVLHTHLQLRVVLSRRTKGQSLGTSLKEGLFWKSGNI